MGACSLPAFPLPEFHWACQRQGGGGIEEIWGVALLSSWPTLACPYFFSPPQSLSSCGTFLCFPCHTSSLPSCEVFFSFREAILASDCVHQCLSRLNLCLNSADHHHCVGNIIFFTVRSSCTVWAKSLAFCVLNLCHFCSLCQFECLCAFCSAKWKTPLTINLMFYLICFRFALFYINSWVNHAGHVLLLFTDIIWYIACLQ